MRRLTAAVLATVFCYASAWAEQVDLPHTFTPNTPAKASEVNDNMAALADALGNLKRINLYQNNVKIGSSIFANLIKLNTDYVAVVSKKKGDNRIFLKQGPEVLYYTDSAPGVAYTNKTMNEDLLSGEVGLIVGFLHDAYYMSTPATPTTVSVSSFLDKKGAFVSIDGYTANAACGTMLDAGGTSRNIRCNRVTYTLNGCPYSGCWLDGQYLSNGSTYTLVQRFDKKNYSYSQMMSSFPSSTISSGNLILDVFTEKLDATGYLVNAYALTSNNPAVTGVTTTGCIDQKNRMAVCLPNAQLLSE